MKFATLLQLIGSGSVLILAGVILLVGGASWGIALAVHNVVPPWVVFAAAGLALLVIGILLVDRGGVEAVEEVKASPPLNLFFNPLAAAGTAVVAGVLLYFLLRKRPRKVIVAASPSIAPAVKAAVREAEGAPPPPQQQAARGFGFTQFLTDQLISTASMAAAALLPLAMQALGVPTVQEILDDLASGKSDKDGKSGKPEAVGEERDGHSSNRPPGNRMPLHM